VFAYADDISGGAGNQLVLKDSGSDGLDGLTGALEDNQRAYGFLRVTAGDEMSVRGKFVLISWVPDRAPIKKKAAVSTHKGFVKEVCKDFSVEVHATDRDDLAESEIMKLIKKAGGASYGSSTS
jgi:hypothetical protein